MGSAKIAISIDNQYLKRLDCFVGGLHGFKSRSQAIQYGVIQALEHLEHSRLAKECSKLDINFERTMAEEGLVEDLKEWPEY
jgi:metal-responsive CopG/Arc/MetJ family transcriptional regulator